MTDRLENGLTPNKDLKLEMRALREGWPISPERKQEILENICNIAAGKGKDGEKISASTAVKAFNSLVIASKPTTQTAIQVNNFGSASQDILDAESIVDGLLATTTAKNDSG